MSRKWRDMPIGKTPDHYFDGRNRRWTGDKPLDQRHVNLAIDALKASARDAVIFWGADAQTRFEMMLFQSELFDGGLCGGAYEIAWLALRRAQRGDDEAGDLLGRAASNLEARI